MNVDAESAPQQPATLPGPPQRRVPGRSRSFWRTARDMGLIIASILIAFTLDRWWDAARERADEQRYLNALHQEFTSNSATLQASRENLRTIDAAVVQLLALIGPQPRLIPPDSLAALFDYSFRFSVLELPSGSLEGLMASGDLSIVSNERLKAGFAAWPARLAQARSNAELLVQNREELIRYLDSLMPTLAIARNWDNERRGGSLFPIPVAAVLSDMRVEGLLGNREVRLYNVIADHRKLIAAADTIIILIEQERR